MSSSSVHKMVDNCFHANYVSAHDLVQNGSFRVFLQFYFFVIRLTKRAIGEEKSLNTTVVEIGYPYVSVSVKAHRLW